MHKHDTKFGFQRLIQLTRIHHPTNINVISAGVKDLGKASASGPGCTTVLITLLGGRWQAKPSSEYNMKIYQVISFAGSFPQQPPTRQPLPSPHRKCSLFSILLAHRMHSLWFTIQAGHSTQLSRTRNKNLFHLIPWDPPDHWRPKAETCRHFPPGHFHVSPLSVSFLPRGCFRFRIIYP